MKTVDGSSKKKFLFLMALAFIMIISCYIYHNHATYESIKVVVKEAATVEYGSANYDIEKLIKEVDGEIVSIKKDIDTKVVGEQEVIVEVRKDNIIKEVPIIISVVDSAAPEIKLNKEKITITKGDSYDLESNIASVIDEVDGEISLLKKEVKDENKENTLVSDDDLENSVKDKVETAEESSKEKENTDSKGYYELNYTDDLDSVGSHEIIVTAVDSYGNTATMSFTLEVLAPKPVVAQVSAPVYSNLPANQAAGDLVSIAYSLVGSPYIAGANGPYGFDCSGFVQYVYSKVGVNVSRSSSTQLYDGVAVSYQDAQPGDILSWGYVDGVATHSALYVGNGQMVHATNPSQGVIASDVAAWTRGSGTRVISVRRIK